MEMVWKMAMEWNGEVMEMGWMKERSFCRRVWRRNGGEMEMEEGTEFLQNEQNKWRTELREGKIGEENKWISGLHALMIASPPFIGLRGRWSSFGSCNRTARGGVGLAVFFV